MSDVPKIASATIIPIKAKDIKFIGTRYAFKIDGIFSPELVNENPIRVTEETLSHAETCARKIIDRMSNLPWSKEASDLLSMAYAILHYEAESHHRNAR
jgi:hypothetical protein